MKTQTGSCPKCGAPIYVETIWHGILPPPPIYSCGCNMQTVKYTTTTSSPEIYQHERNQTMDIQREILEIEKIQNEVLREILDILRGQGKDINLLLKVSFAMIGILSALSLVIIFSK